MAIHGDKRTLLWRFNGFALAEIGFDTRAARALVKIIVSICSISSSFVCIAERFVPLSSG
jgi:hypothetical protein